MPASEPDFPARCRCLRPAAGVPARCRCPEPQRWTVAAVRAVFGRQRRTVSVVPTTALDRCCRWARLANRGVGPLLSLGRARQPRRWTVGLVGRAVRLVAGWGFVTVWVV